MSVPRRRSATRTARAAISDPRARGLSTVRAGPCPPIQTASHSSHSSRTLCPRLTTRRGRLPYTWMSARRARAAHRGRGRRASGPGSASEYGLSVRARRSRSPLGGAARGSGQLALRDGGLHRVQRLLHERAQALVLLDPGEVLLEDLAVGELLAPEHGAAVVDAHFEAGLLQAEVLGLDVVLLAVVLVDPVHTHNHVGLTPAPVVTRRSHRSKNQLPMR